MTTDPRLSPVGADIATGSMTMPHLTRPMMNLGQRQVTMLDLLRSMKGEGASDMFLQTGSPLRFKKSGRVATMPTPMMTREMLRHVMACFLSKEEVSLMARRRSADVVFQDSGDRYRVHFAFGHTGPYASVRLIGADIIGLDELSLPHPVIKWLKHLTHGVLVICGATDSGKTVTSTALLDHFNETHERAILTLEDPIEYVLTPRKSMIVQKEVGLHAASFADGIRSALRENLDVIFVGEMRERDTIEQVLRAGETGHLVVTTLHADDAMSAVLRIVGTYPPDDQPRIRQSLAGTLAGVLYQRLLPRREGKGRIPCVETLWANTAVRAILRSGDLSKMASYVGRATGGVGYRDCLLDLRSFNEIEEDTLQEEMRRVQRTG